MKLNKLLIMGLMFVLLAGFGSAYIYPENACQVFWEGHANKKLSKVSNNASILGIQIYEAGTGSCTPTETLYCQEVINDYCSTGTRKNIVMALGQIGCSSSGAKIIDHTGCRVGTHGCGSGSQNAQCGRSDVEIVSPRQELVSYANISGNFSIDSSVGVYEWSSNSTEVVADDCGVVEDGYYKPRTGSLPGYCKDINSMDHSVSYDASTSDSQTDDGVNASADDSVSNAGAGITLDFTGATGMENVITVGYDVTPITPTAFTGTAIKYFDIAFLDLYNTTEYSGTVNITVSYTEGQLGNLDEDRLVLYLWDGTANAWISGSNAGVDTVNNVVYGVFDASKPNSPGLLGSISSDIETSILLIVNLIPLLTLMIAGFVGVIAAFIGIIVITITIRFMKEIMEMPVELLKGVIK